MTTLPHTPRAARAFTLLEMMVALAAVLLLSIGVSQVFRATGATIKVGKRISNLQSVAATVENQLRHDFAGMSRDGFLLIRNEVANVQGNAPQPVELYKDQRATPAGQPTRPGEKRRRRIDELLFFARGEFTTQHDPIHPARIVRSDQARIYVGHGLRNDRSSATVPYTDPVFINQSNDDNTPIGSVSDLPYALGRTDDPSPTPPNRYASDWILVRHAALLVKPAQVQSDPPSGSRIVPTLGLTSQNKWLDSQVQIGLQPAAASIFRVLAETNNNQPLPPGSMLVRSAGPTHAFPLFGSGIVDIAATDLSEVRAFVLGGNDPATIGSTPQQIPNGFVPAANSLLNARIMQAWMREALPANSDTPTLTGPVIQGGRMRCEPAPPNALGNDNGSGNWNNAPEFLRADQRLLSASNLVVGCSEFIVEWSFGRTYPSNPADPLYNPAMVGQTIWHGLDRWDDVNNDGQHQPNERWFAQRYNSSSPAAAISFSIPHRDAALPPIIHPTDSRLIHDGATVSATVPTRACSYFGYIDPTFNPDQSAPPNGTIDDPVDAAVATVPWPWPTMVRITMSLVDPDDPTIEQTFQFIFKVPDAPSMQ